MSRRPLTLRQLLDHPGVEEVFERRGRFGFLAYHGGNLERGTDAIAAAAAERAGASLYAIRQPPDLRLHIASAEHDPAAAPALAAFLAHVEVAVSIHGYGRRGMWTTLLVGGGNRPLGRRVAAALRCGLGPGFTVVDDVSAIPRELRGLHPRNPVNLPRGGGVQVELPPRVRSGNDVPSYRPEYEDAIVAALAAVAGAGPDPDDDEAGAVERA